MADHDEGPGPADDPGVAPPRPDATPRPPRAVGRIDAAAVAGAFLVVAAVLHAFGVGGYRQGGLVCAVVLAGIVGGLAFRLLRASPNRNLWLAVVIVAAVVAAGVLADRAPWSTGRLAAEMDELELPFFAVASDDRSGHSWCRPTCPVLTRTYRAPNTAVRPTMITIVSAFVNAGLLDEEIIRTVGAEPTARLRTERVAIDVRIGDVSDQTREVVLRYRSLR